MDESVALSATPPTLAAPDWPHPPTPGSLLLRPVWKDGAWQWRFRRNCALRPGQVLGMFAGFALTSIVVAVIFWFRGVHLVMPFTGLELAAVGAALLVDARHAGDYERIAISAEAIEVEWMRGGREGRAVFDPRRTRIETQGRGLVQLSQQEQRALIGRHLRPDRRPSLARDLRRAVLLT